MKEETWSKLTPLQREVLFVAITVRNRLEDFHCEHLDDSQMKILNQTIRDGLMEAFILYERGLCAAKKYQSNKKLNFSDNYWMSMFGITAKMIPDYWEIPSEEKIEKELKADLQRNRQLHKKHQEAIKQHD